MSNATPNLVSSNAVSGVSPSSASSETSVSRIPNSPYFNRTLRFVTALDSSGRYRLAAVTAENSTCSKE